VERIFCRTQTNGVYLSTNNGTSWTQVNNGLTDTYVKALAISGTYDLFAVLGQLRSYLSTNNGTSWTQINSGLTNNSVNCLAVNGTIYLLGTQGGGIFFPPIMHKLDCS